MSVSYSKDEYKYRSWMVPLNNTVLIIKRMQKWPILWEVFGFVLVFFSKNNPSL